MLELIENNKKIKTKKSIMLNLSIFFKINKIQIVNIENTIKSKIDENKT